MTNDQPDKLDLRSHDIAEEKRQELLRPSSRSMLAARGREGSC